MGSVPPATCARKASRLSRPEKLPALRSGGVARYPSMEAPPLEAPPAGLDLVEALAPAAGLVPDPRTSATRVIASPAPRSPSTARAARAARPGSISITAARSEVPGMLTCVFSRAVWIARTVICATSGDALGLLAARLASIAAASGASRRVGSATGLNWDDVVLMSAACFPWAPRRGRGDAAGRATIYKLYPGKTVFWRV